MKPILPERDILPAHQSRSIARGLACVALGSLTHTKPAVIHEANWRTDHLAALVMKQAVSPTATGDFEGASGATFLQSLAPNAAIIRLFAKCPSFNLTGIDHLLFRGISIAPVPVFVGEGKSMSMLMGTTSAGQQLGPVKKMLAGTAVSSELEFAVPETASAVIGRAIAQHMERNFDAQAFDANPADDDRPAGVLNGVTPLTASASVGLEGIAADIATLAAAITAAGGDADRMIVVAGSKAAVVLRLLSGVRFLNPIIGTGAIPDDTVIAIDPNGFGSGYSGSPTIELSTQATAVFEDTNPPAIATPGSPNVLGGSVKSAHQNNLLFIKVRLNSAFGALQAGIVQVINGVAWA